MKTNVVMKSQDRHLFGVTIRQETKTGFLNLTDLQEAYNSQSDLEGWSEKKISDLLYNKSNAERIFYILEKQEVIKSSFNDFIEQVENETITKVLKRLKAYKTTGARHTKTTWVNPYIWVLVAMEMNPKLYGEVVTWLTDGLILNRIEAGNFYVKLSSQMKNKFEADGRMYSDTAKALNFCIFNRHENSMRNTATAQQLKDLEDLEKTMAFSIQMGYVKTYDQFLSDLRKIWRKKFQNNNPMINQ